jgi:hypothetical protein
MINNCGISAPLDHPRSSPPSWSIGLPICSTASPSLHFKGRGNKRASLSKSPRPQRLLPTARPRHPKQQSKFPVSMNIAIKTGSWQEVPTIRWNRIFHNSIDDTRFPRWTIRLYTMRSCLCAQPRYILRSEDHCKAPPIRNSVVYSVYIKVTKWNALILFCYNWGFGINDRFSQVIRRASIAVIQRDNHLRSFWVHFPCEWWSDVPEAVMEIPNSAEILGSSRFGDRQSLSSMSFESNLRVTLIESDAFAVSSFETIGIPCQGDVLGFDAVLACTMSPCAQTLPGGVSGHESFFALNIFRSTSAFRPFFIILGAERVWDLSRSRGHTGWFSSLP